MRASDGGVAGARLRAVLRAVRGGVWLREDEGEGDAGVDRARAEEPVAVQGFAAGGDGAEGGVVLGDDAAEEGRAARGGAGVQEPVHQGRLVQLPDVLVQGARGRGGDHEGGRVWI